MSDVKIYKTKWFSRFASREDISDNSLSNAIKRAEQGLIDADLGGNVIKQRIARPNEGRSGGYRTILYYREGDRALFVYGFAKSARDNISKAELQSFRELAQEFLAYSLSDLEAAVREEKFFEVTGNDQDV